MDTLDSYNQYLSRKNHIMTVKIEYFISKYILSTYLWNKQGDPIFLKENVIPSIQIDTLIKQSSSSYFFTNITTIQVK